METAVVFATVASPIVALLVGTGQILAIYFGLREMSKANKDRAKIVNDQGLLSAEICADLREQMLCFGTPKKRVQGSGNY